MFPEHFDRTYFASASWKSRVRRWLAAATGAFAAANKEAIERMLSNPQTTVRVVINARADALCGFLSSGRYRNRYELGETEIGAKGPDQNRLRADARVGAGPGHYFAALAMGGAGLRYFGEFCIVLEPGFVDGSTQLFDRDSYDTLFGPLDGVADEDLKVLKGTWDDDVRYMVLMRVLPELRHDRQITTGGSVSEHVLHDQEYIEVHLHRQVTPGDVDQVVEAPETIAMDTLIAERQRRGQAVHMHELEWQRRRSRARQELDRHGIRHRVVTPQGRGYQWR